jgi:hypothetical protein
MAKKKGDEFEKVYTGLKLRYALENPEIRYLFEEWIKKEDEHKKNFYSMIRKYRKHQNAEPFKLALKEIGLKRAESRNVLIEKLAELGILLDDIRWSESLTEFLKGGISSYDDFNVLPLSGIFIKVEGQLFHFQSPENNSKFVEILKEGFNKKNEEWFVEKYGNIDFLVKIETETGSQQFNTNKEGWKFNKRTKKFYVLLYDSVFSEDDVLEDDKYLNLKIDLSKRNEDIERDLRPIIKYFKDIVDDISPIGKTKARRQNIDLYKQYLRVYELVQEKGEKWTEIAKEIFPEDFKSEDEQLESDSHNIPNPESAIAKVHNYNKEAKRLIAEGLP